MEHKLGGSYTGRIPCRCDSCRAQHARDAREYRLRRRPPTIGQLKADIRELEAFKAGVLAARSAQAQVTQ